MRDPIEGINNNGGGFRKRQRGFKGNYKRSTLSRSNKLAWTLESEIGEFRIVGTQYDTINGDRLASTTRDCERITDERGIAERLAPKVHRRAADG